ncbi:hypothetical protein QYF61_011121 [Mycteria americana]|uniref:Uncharacterized protein n=1 Tax=Mycteria americana TaxID=33587 RepID=A0AAN7NFJ5_MYCAM|nr:hypothetical protein QYF61_011121 [Mycteria americana]
MSQECLLAAKVANSVLGYKGIKGMGDNGHKFKREITVGYKETLIYQEDSQAVKQLPRGVSKSQFGFREIMENDVESLVKFKQSEAVDIPKLSKAERLLFSHMTTEVRSENKKSVADYTKDSHLASQLISNIS